MSRNPISTIATPISTIAIATDPLERSREVGGEVESGEGELHPVLHLDAADALRQVDEPLEVDDEKVGISPDRQRLGGRLVVAAHRAEPGVVLVQVLGQGERLQAVVQAQLLLHSVLQGETIVRL